MNNLALIAIAAVLLTGCSKSAAPTPAAPTAAAPAAHAAAAAVPGSHEDWCGEHGVAESQCTRCNADLIPAFKATGDWCEEHGLPESQCLKCNPDLKLVRPPKVE
jgi:cytochrome c5